MSEALILRNDASLSISWTEKANALKEEALTVAAGVGKVVDAASNQRAVEAMQSLAAILKQVEAARKACKEPVLTFGKKIDEAAKAFIEELTTEQWRLSQLVGAFQEIENKRALAARQAENERLAKIERERQAELAKATTHEQMDKVDEKFNNRVQQEQPQPIAPIRAEGQRVEQVINFEVFDIGALYAAKPQCVKMEPKAVEIKALLKAGVQLPGVRSWKETKASVRVPGQRVIEA
jgi:chromosome segregation ATPase